MPLSDVTTNAERALLEHQTLRAASTAARVRLTAVALFVPVLIALHLAADPGWGTYLGPVLAYALLAAALWAARKVPWLARHSALLFLLDVLVVFELQRRSLPTSPFPSGVAGFSLGLFALLVAMCAVSMRRHATWAVAVLASAAQVTLMRLAGVGWGAAVIAALVLLVLASASSTLVGRLRAMVRELASTEVAWRREQEQVTELTRAKDTISTLLGDAQAQNQRLEQLQADKEQLTSLLVHDLRSPLSSVRANLDWVKSELPKDFDPDVLDALTESRGVTDRLSAMVGDLLNITRLESGQLQLQREAFACRSALTGLHRQLQSQARSRRVSVELVSEDLLVDADASLLARVLENISSNALRYTPSGGRIRLELSRERDDAVFAVRNDGPVIPPEARGRLFDKFVQAGSASENRRAGWGLGLYFCRLTAEAHGGSIAVVDEPGWPTSFVVRIPGATSSAPAHAA